MAPMVSIIMATYNRSNFIAEAVQSIQKQIYTNWELLIINDGGTDNTEVVLEPFLQDRRIKYLQRPAQHKKGLPGCRNYGLQIAQGQYIIFFDDDDVVHRENLQLCVSELAGTANVFCRYKIKAFTGTFDAEFIKTEAYKKDFLSQKNLEEIITQKIPFNSCAVMWQKEFVGKEMFNENLMYAEEWEFYTRILSKGAEGVAIDKVLYYARKHPDSNTGEYWTNNSLRKSSKIKAVVLVINQLEQKNRLSENLINYFIQMSFFLKEPSILAHILKVSKAGTFKKIKYRVKFKIYPFLKPLIRIKFWF